MAAESHPARGASDARVAVIVPCFEDGRFLPDAVASVREREPVEIVVVDDGSQDSETIDVIARLEAAGIKVERHERTRGVSAARMTGLASTTAPFVFPLDADDLLLENVLAAMADRLEEAQAAACWGDYVELRPKRPLFRAVPDRLDPYRLAFTNEFPISALFRREVLESVGGWQPLGLDHDLRSDWSLWLTLAERGVTGVHLGAKRATYMRRMHPGRLTSLASGRQRALRGALRSAHPRTFEHLSRHRENSDLRGMRRRLFPVVYGARVPGLDRRVKAVLDRLGVWTLQHELDDASRAGLLQSARDARQAGGRLVGRRLPSAPSGSGRPPIIVIGSGRSGTAYVTRVLEGLGLFMGERQDQNAEAFHFIRVNTALLARAGVSWSTPEIFPWLLEDSSFRSRALSYAQSRLRRPYGLGYLGWRNYLEGRSILDYDEPWGWKDPRNTFTLPLWLELFPDAKVIHVLRHGADVAGSLWRQQDRPRPVSFLISAAGKRRFHLPTIAREAAVWLRTKSHFPRVTRFDSPEEGIRLWSTYVDEASRHARALGPNALELRFEDLLAAPEEHIGRLAEFCDVRAPDELIAELATKADPSRAFAFRDNAELLGLAQRSEDRLAPYGYGPEGRRVPAEAAPAAARLITNGS